MQLRISAPGAVVLAGLAAILAFGLQGIARYPAIFSAERVPWVLADGAILLAYAVIALTLPSLARPRPSALWPATWIGLGAGVLQGIEIAREDLMSMAPTLALATGAAGFLVMFALFGLAGALPRRGPAAGAMGGAWCAVVAMVTMWIIASTLDNAIMDRLAHIWPSDYDYTHGNTLLDTRAYTLWNTMSAAFSHALLLPLLGAVIGLLAGATRRALASRHASAGDPDAA